MDSEPSVEQRLLEAARQLVEELRSHRRWVVGGVSQDRAGHLHVDHPSEENTNPVEVILTSHCIAEAHPPRMHDLSASAHQCLSRYLASGMTTEEIVADFPELTPEHVRAAIDVGT